MVERVAPGVVRVTGSLGGGSGVIFEVDSIAGTALLLTNYHVIDGSADLSVIVGEVSPYVADIVGFDVARDLAILEICCSGEFLTIEFAEGESLRTGTEVIALGYPLGATSLTVTEGIISSMRYDAELDRHEIQSSAAINAGNSGGPLLNLEGRLVGVNTYVIRSAPGAPSVEGFGFAVSITTVDARLDDLKLRTVTAVPTPTPNPLAPGGTYSNETYGYSIEVPEGWDLDASDPNFVTVWETKAGAWVSVQVSVPGSNLYSSLSSLIEAFEPAVSSELWSEFVLLETGFVKSGSAYEWTFNGLWDGGPYKGIVHWYLVDGILYDVGIIGLVTVWNSNEYDEIERRLRLTGVSFEPPLATLGAPTPTPYPSPTATLVPSQTSDTSGPVLLSVSLSPTEGYLGDTFVVEMSASDESGIAYLSLEALGPDGQWTAWTCYPSGAQTESCTVTQTADSGSTLYEIGYYSPGFVLVMDSNENFSTYLFSGYGSESHTAYETIDGVVGPSIPHGFSLPDLYLY